MAIPPNFAKDFPGSVVKKDPPKKKKKVHKATANQSAAAKRLLAQFQQGKKN